MSAACDGPMRRTLIVRPFGGLVETPAPYQRDYMSSFPDDMISRYPAFVKPLRSRRFDRLYTEPKFNDPTADCTVQRAGGESLAALSGAAVCHLPEQFADLAHSVRKAECQSCRLNFKKIGVQNI